MNHPRITRCKVRQWLDAAFEAVASEKASFDPALPGVLLDAMKLVDFPNINPTGEPERKAS